MKQQENSLLQAAECHHNLAVYADRVQRIRHRCHYPSEANNKSKEKEKFRSHIYKPKGIVHYADSKHTKETRKIDGMGV